MSFSIECNGVIYDKDVGQATITISSLDGTLLDRCVIVVKEDHAKDDNSSDSNGTASGSDGSTSGSNSNISEKGGSDSESNGNISGSNVDGKSDMEEKPILSESNLQNTDKIENYNIVVPSKKLATRKRVKLALVNGKNMIDDTSIKWVSGNKKYATVDSKGILICKKNGIGKTVTITATSADGKRVLATVMIKIMKHAVTRVRIKTAQKKMKAGKRLRLQTIIETSGVRANKN